MKLTRPTLLLTLLALCLAPSSASARFDGITGRSTTGCSPCHGGVASGSVSATLDGPSELSPGEMQVYTLTISEVTTGGGALDVSIAGGGALINTDTNTRLDTGEIVHDDAFDTPPAGNIGDWVYDFMVMAPEEVGAMLTVAAAFMSFNGDFDNTDADLWNLDSWQIAVVPEPGTGVMVGLGLVGLASLGRRRPRRALSRSA